MSPFMIPCGFFGAGSSLQSWDDWDESSEDTLDTTNTFVCKMENTSAGGDEVGVGLELSETNRTLTACGTSIPGASGDPLVRAINATNQMFTCATDFLDTFFLDNTWTYIQKVHDFGTSGGSVVSLLGGNSGASPMLYTTLSGSVLQFNWADDSGYPGVQSTSGSISTSGALYICQWSDGTYVRAGFCTSKPTKWSDFDSTDRVSISRDWALTSPTWGKQHLLASENGATFRDIEYVVVSADCLIDNSS